ncbi:MAG: DUF362 domain-containing protein [Anaerolineales bacterium]|nr:MAG: DUF362 domain-containing protein [Anaerolineales bacterium]
MNRTAIIKCTDYQPDRVDRAVRESLNLLGGIERYVRPGARVLIKPNLITARRPDEAATTHPAVVKALVQIVQVAGGLVTIADSPGGPFSHKRLEEIYTASGMAQVATETGARLNYDLSTVNLPHPEGRLLKGVTVIKAVAEADVVITVPRLKTHTLTGLTGAVKVAFGAVPSPLKTEYHLRMPKVGDFSQALLDIYTLVNPCLTVMDAVVGMEGEGPSAGDPRPIGAILASADSLACDVAAAALVGFDPLAVSTTRAAVRLGLTSGQIADVELVGDPLSEVKVGSFRPASTWLATNRISEFLLGLYGRVAGPKPVMNSACNGCRTCLRNCPPQAITMVNKRPVVDYDQCIRCFCCQELCPQQAVTIHHPWLCQVILRAREAR